jgi:hypothetical protein
MRQAVEDFMALNIRRKFCLISSWVAATGGALLIGSSAVTLAFWANDNEPTPITKAKNVCGIRITFRWYSAHHRISFGRRSHK